MFEKILIANRGEIAARIIRTCKKMGIRSVAVYSDADAQAPHVRSADEAYLLGPAQVKESYLNMVKIIEIAKECGADAIHPGYGFLSENTNFADRCKEAGIVFIGPSPNVIQRMGSKIESRKAMEKAGVPIVPGISYPLADVSEALREANKMGYPIMLKASAGGGGIGMQIVQNDAQLEKAFDSNAKRAEQFFGDGAMYMEKYIEDPRHIEIQLMADQHGNVVYLGERECSIQRRHQKVIEEALSPFLDVQTREKMGAEALKAAKFIGYDSLGTIEFLVDKNKNFYFLEMNTRLQVEHPVTEEITGLDLVEQMIRIAAGEALTVKQNDVKYAGHAIEARIYAEDPNTFFPSPGKITKLELPEAPYIRHELAVTGNSTVTPFYDPMIAKLIAVGKDRQEAIARLMDALDEYVVEGIKTNIPFLKKVVSHQAFQSGDTTTGFIEKYMK